jgi:hypothetical protein
VGAEGPESAAFIPESDRFVRDVAAEERLRRDEAAARHARDVLRRREAASARDDERWRRMDEAKRAEEERVRALQASGAKAQKNAKSVPYDPLTLAYDTTEAGARLRHEDEAIQYRAALRAQNLQMRSRGAAYDLLSGADAPLAHVPGLPRVPREVPPERSAGPAGGAGTSGALRAAGGALAGRT